MKVTKTINADKTIKCPSLTQHVGGNKYISNIQAFFNFFCKQNTLYVNKNEYNYSVLLEIAGAQLEIVHVLVFCHDCFCALFA